MMGALAAVMTQAAGAAAPSVYSGVATGLAVLMLLTEFAMLRAAMLRAQIRLYAAQSLLLSALAVVVAIDHGIPDLYALAGVSLVFKVIVVPAIMMRMLRRAGAQIAGSGALGVASEVLLAIVVAVVGFLAPRGLGIESGTLPPAAFGLSLAVVLVAFVLMIVRRDVVSQAVGFFSLENGGSLAGLVVAAGMPLILEVAFLFDLLVAVVVFGVLIRVHHSTSSSLSTVGLTDLKG